MNNKRKSKGEGTIRQRKDGSYEGRFTKNGLKAKYFYGKSEREVKIKMNNYKAEAISQDSNCSSIILNDCIEMWLRKEKYRVVKPNTYVTLQNTYKCHIKDSIGSKQMKDITAEDINKLIDKESEIRSYSTVKKIVQLLRANFEYAIKNGEINYNPVKDARMKKENNMPIKTKQINILKNQDIEKIYKFIDNVKDYSNHFYKQAPAIGLMLNTGMRTGEALGLKWTDINQDEKYIKVSRNLVVVPNYEKRNKDDTKRIAFETSPKTKSSTRYIPLNEKALEMIKLIKQYNERNNIKTEYVVSTDKGKYVSARNLQRTFDSILATCDIQHFGLHSLRHTFATRLLSNNVDIKIVSKLLGHSKIEITYNKYIHICEEDKIKAIKMIPMI